MNRLQVVSSVFVVIIIVAMILLGVRVINFLQFLVVAGVCAIFAYWVLPRWKK